MIAPTPVPRDPMLPLDDGREALVEPLSAVTLVTGDARATRRFYEGALGLVSTTELASGEHARALASHWDLGLAGDIELLLFRRPTVRAITVRAIVVPEGTPSNRPGYDTRITGALGIGCPVNGLERRDRIVGAFGFRSTAGVVSMSFPRADGTEYEVGEIHWEAPDDVLVLGVDRAHLQPVGPLDTALDIGGPAYSSACVGNTQACARFFDGVLGLEMRREFVFESRGLAGGLHLPPGTRVRFQQWFAPGSRHGYLVVMQILENALPPPHPLGPRSRGLAMWSFATARLHEIRDRAREAAVQVLREPALMNSPGFGPVRSMMLATPDGFPVEVYERVPL